MKYFPIFVALVLFIVLISIFRINCDEVKESWVNYKEGPYGNFQTTNANPVVFYNVPRYRKPYRWPVVAYTQHPISQYINLG
jgi:hypothetical protein